MGAYVFNNQIFDSWLTKMSDDILSKVNRERITTEEMIILILKAQTNHFHHMDIEMKEELGSVRSEMKEELGSVRSEMKEELGAVRSEMKEELGSVRGEIKVLRKDMQDLRTELKNDMLGLRKEVKEDIHKLDSKMDNRFMWSIGITITLSIGIYLKLFLG